MDSTLSVMRLHPHDDVLIALADLPQGADLPGGGITAEAIARGHKVAARDIAKGDDLRRYGQVIGVATADIGMGGHIHTHNLGMGAYHRDYAHGIDAVAMAPAPQARTFDGFRRSNGGVGTRNYIGILTSVNCSGDVARFIAEQAEASEWFAGLENVDGIVPVVHGTGCGMADDNEGYATLFRTIAGYSRNPNFAGILLVGLGCEMMQIPDLIGSGRMRGDQFRYMTIQATGGTRATVTKGVDIARELAEAANAVVRAPAPISHLCVALQCGGSDGYSGITANPALGVASDMIVAHGGTTILAETPEIYGAEHLLTRRAVHQEVGEKLVERIKWWESYTAMNGAKMDNNPSPGNKRGGLTTILEKSLGAVAKGGSAPLAGVYKYAEPITTPGLTFMDSPGYDPCSVTGQIASGATLVCFTTGRGSVSGYKPSPCVKLATNSEMYARMAEDMDINCGDIISDGCSIEQKGAEIFEMFIDVASGRRTKSEALGFGGAEFVPWQIGAVM